MGTIPIISAALALVLAGGCDDASTGSDKTPGDDDPATTGDTEDPTGGGTTGNTDDPDDIPALVGGVADFDIRAVVQQGYWYSRYNLGSLTMMSGNGTLFMPDMDMVGDMVDLVSDDNSTATPPANAALPTRVFNTGTPAYANPDDGDPMDLADQRWTSPVDVPTTLGAAAWTLTKEVEWSRQFHVDAHFGTPGDDGSIPGAMERFKGLVMYTNSVMQTLEWINNPTAFDDSSASGTYAMLIAVTDLADVTARDAMPHSTTNRHRDVADMMGPDMGWTDADDLADMLMDAADDLFNADPAVSTVTEHAIAIQGLAWYAMVSETNRDAAKTRMGTLADALVAANKSTPAEHGIAIRGLIEAHRVLGTDTYLTEATASYQALEDDFDWEHGVFWSQDTYTTSDVAAIIAGLNATLVWGDLSLPNVTTLLEHFFEAVVNISGFQISAPPLEATAEYEHLSSELYHRYPTTPVPPMADGTYGTAPVFASWVTWDAGTNTWTASSEFDTEGAMHLSNEMLWMHVDEVSGFPEVP